MTVLSKLKVYATEPHPCSYLEEQQATTVFIDPEARIDHETYSRLSDIGFRRSGAHIYRPHCQRCNACVPARVPVEQFRRRRRHQRIWNRNQDLRVVEVGDIRSDSYYHLFERYISVRHSDGDMFPPSREQYDSFLTNNFGVTHFYAFLRGEQIVAVAVCDHMDTGLSAIYTFFDPAQDKRSLGVYAVLWQIEECKRLKLPSVYLGYWIKGCRKMNYKTDYRPLELFIDGRWLLLS